MHELTSEERELYLLTGQYYAILQQAFERTPEGTRGLVPFGSRDQTFFEYRPNHDSVEFTTYIRANNFEKVRLDYEFKIGAVIPPEFAEQIARDYWFRLKRYMETGQHPATYAVKEEQ